MMLLFEVIIILKVFLIGFDKQATAFTWQTILILDTD